MIEFSTSSLSSRKRVKIDGHVYTVRRMGAGEELDASTVIRELKKLSSRINKSNNYSEKDMELYDKLQARSLDIFVGLFDDGGDGTKSRELIGKLSFEDRTEMVKQIFSVDTKEKDSLDGNEQS